LFSALDRKFCIWEFEEFIFFEEAFFDVATKFYTCRLAQAGFLVVFFTIAGDSCFVFH
jgi:hypothetical protein